MRMTWWIVLLVVLLATGLAVAGAWGASTLLNNRVYAPAGSAVPNVQPAPRPGVPGGQDNQPGSGCWDGQMPDPGRMHPGSEQMPGPFGRDGSRRMPMQPGGRSGLNRGNW